ncbi:hypothetical protein BRADI_4g17160v3 [Brachypodium distachyon]|uniref:Helicase C-terminal domain-containing protein n=1 Tax=Brachypodium distachyon TaxID=15368 RepID=A0A0Q3H4G9_BRADI|nr:hypothetical protein BRADI_4g17160v3 [Brachypodium distachyon]
MATPIPPAPPPNPHHLLLHRPPALTPPRRLRLPIRRPRIASAAAATATATAPDDIAQLNHRLRVLVRRRDAASSASSASSSMDPVQAEAYLHMIREQQRLGLRQLRRDPAGQKEERDSGVDDGDEEEEGGGRRKGMAAGSSLGHRVDPRELEPGEYVVHKKVGVGKFVCISGEDGEDYVFIQYADAMAKLAVDQAARMLYRYNLPHEKKRPRSLSKLNDPSTWEKRRLKGKLAVQKMVVNLMELYLQRMRQRRSPYTRPEAIDQFAAEFPYEPTPDQNQSKEEKDELITQIKSGHLQIIVGTHALLTERMAYNNLGLLVVDEEQKFGVQQKEKIASYKSSIDVLTLSATPIPRTLYLALTGFRDASLMSTPPPERVAVKTYVSAFSRERALSAIKLELKRGGQVFYVVPRIKDDVLQFLKDSLPDVPMAVAHGKKVSKNIQLAMEKFSCGEIKILVCTHIIESGIDIPNANTMIVQYAELFGLAQLYQLRGRVGRSGREGFTYLFYTDKSLLSRIAMDRLGAIEEHSDLGQGFHVAEKDMGIRGFGSMFGEQQSGDVANVGIDLFFDMLFDSLSKVDQFCINPVPYKDVQLDINISAHLSSEYISYLENPVELLNEAAKAAEKDIWTLTQFTEDLRRQYGKEPRDMELLLKKLYVRRMAADLGICRIYPSGKTIIMKTNMNKKVFRLMVEAMASETHRNSLTLTGKEIKAELLVTLPDTLLLNWLFHCLADCYAVMPALVKY